MSKYQLPVKTPAYVMLSSDYSAQEPRITAYVSQDPKMIKTFQEGKDIYANIASLSFGYPYEECLEFHPETGEYQPEGKKRRTEAKSVVLGRVFSDLAVKYICPDSRNPIYQTTISKFCELHYSQVFNRRLSSYRKW